jgi:hypothetical protein
MEQASRSRWLPNTLLTACLVLFAYLAGLFD